MKRITKEEIFQVIDKMYADTSKKLNFFEKQLSFSEEGILWRTRVFNSELILSSEDFKAILESYGVDMESFRTTYHLDRSTFYRSLRVSENLQTLEILCEN